MDTRTRHALKKDKFAQATASSVGWVSDHRSGVLRWSIVAVIALLVVVVGGLVAWTLESSAAGKALGVALDTYAAPLAQPGAPVEAGTYATAADRSKAANQQFSDVANKYGWLPEGAKAHYFAGVTDQELGQTAQAETELKTAAGSWDKNLANLAKLALAGLYHRTQRDQQAIDIYNELTAKPSGDGFSECGAAWTWRTCMWDRASRLRLGRCGPRSRMATRKARGGTDCGAESWAGESETRGLGYRV